MRSTLLLLTPLLLAGCIKQSGHYNVSDARDHAISVRAEQEYAWDKHLTLSIIAARLPDCQRRFSLDRVHADDVAVELFSSGENQFVVRSGEQLLQIDMQSCTQLPEPAPNALGNAVGVFRLGEGQKLQFEPATAGTQPAPAAAPAQ